MIQQIPTYKSGVTIDADYFKSIAFAYVQEYGYKSGESVHDLTSKSLEEFLPCTSLRYVEEMNDWISNFSINQIQSDYVANAIMSWKKKNLEYKDLALVMSFINMYLKDVERKQKIAHNRSFSKSRYVGEVGSSVIFTVKEVEKLYEYDSFSYYDDTTSYLYKIVGTDDNIYLWTTAKDIDTSNTIQIAAKVKGYKEFDGEQETIITRGKITNVSKNG